METNKINEIADLVCGILSKKRVGFLWFGAPLQLPETDDFYWVHYYWHANFAVNAARTYNLAKLRAPMSEGNTLDMLVIPGGTLGIVLEIASGIALSPPAKLTEGALRKNIPVVFEASALRKRLASSGEDSLEAFLKITASLKKRGMEFVGLDDEQPVRRESGDKSAELSGPKIVTLRGGWLSWNEISPLVADVEGVRLASGTKLTPESRDRLLKLNIRVEEAL
jgi:hypothetical protein